MAVLEIEGFDWEPGSNQMFVNLVNKWNGTTFPWTQNGQGSKSAGLSATGSSVNFNTTNGTANCNPGGNRSSLIVGERWLFNAGGVTGTIFSYLDGASAQCGLAINASKQVFFWRGTTATVVATGTKVLVPGAIYYLELKVVFSATGSFDVRIDGVSEIANGSVNTIATANSFAQTVQIGGMNTTGTNVDDFYLSDTTGAAPNNDFLSTGGPVRIETVFMNANDSVTFTPNASTNVSQILETAFDGDATFNSSASTGQIDTFAHANLVSSPATIYAVMAQASMRKDDVTVQTGRTKVKSGATTQNGTSFVMSTVYAHVADIYPLDPNTSAAWTAANVNATKIGYEHV